MLVRSIKYEKRRFYQGSNCYQNVFKKYEQLHFNF